jgi:hypothetical protein
VSSLTNASSLLDDHFDSASVNVDLDNENSLLGIELLGVSRQLRPEAMPRGADECRSGSAACARP